MAVELDSNIFSDMSLDVDVDADNYAEAAAEDVTDRTFQSEEDFQKQKAGYSAKVDQGDHYEELIKVVPALGEEGEFDGRVKLQKKEVMLLGYAVGEMYYEQRYEEILELCGRVRERCWIDKDRKLGESLGRWERRCKGRLEA